MLDESVILSGLEAETLVYRCLCLDDTNSTNEDIKRLIKQDADEGTVVSALTQNGGYGRQGRAWTSPAGGLYLSILLRPADHGISLAALPTLSLVTALAVSDTMRAFSDDQTVAVKWPNDVLCSAGKLCGISLEAISGAVCIGIGTNVFAPTAPQSSPQSPVHPLSHLQSPPCALSHSHPQKSPFPPAYLEHIAREDAGITAASTHVLERVARELLGAFDSVYGSWLEDGFEAFVDTYNRRAFLNGRTVDIDLLGAETLVGGKVVRTAVDGSLVLLDAEGLTHHATSGEAHIVWSGRGETLPI